MKSSDGSLEDFANTIAMIIGGVLFLLSPFIIIWLLGTTSLSGEENSATPTEAAQYEDYRSEQLLNENGEQEACIDQETRDVERYGEWATDTYDCSR